jgi:hypothetical protein
MTYTIETSAESRTASSLGEALRAARLLLNADRVYQGARYKNEDGADCLDVWTSRRNAQRQMNAQADAVISREVR